MSNPASPTEVSTFGAGSFIGAVAVSGNYAYAGAGGDSLRIIDVSNPANPRQVGSFNTTLFISVLDVEVRGNFAYLVSYFDGLHIIDVSNPTSPKEVGFFDTPGSAAEVKVIENLAYVADGPNGLRIIDVSNPATPKEVGFFDTDGSAGRVAVSGNLAYVADEENGLYIIRNDFVPTVVKSPSDRAPERFHLRQSYPNPLRASLSNSGTTITFTLSKAANVTLEVYNMLGEKVTMLVKGSKPAGEHVVNFNTSSLPSGIYFYTLTAGDLKQTRKMVLTR
ncbi:T9SS type A sorting domain-containing protein [candidate division KSB1 bacterium]|nr:T9SS type A sorting domain-containing protein [candidate division KSB1 bacterium]